MTVFYIIVAFIAGIVYCDALGISDSLPTRFLKLGAVVFAAIGFAFVVTWIWNTLY